MAIEQLCRERKVLVAARVKQESFSPEAAAKRVRAALEPYL
jgi:hypothetical protein